MSDINVNVTSAGAANIAVSNGSTVSTTVGNGGIVNVSLGTISPGNATVVSGTLTINSTTTLAAGSSAYAKNSGTAYAALLDLGIPAGPATNVAVGNTTTLAAGSNATVTATANGSDLTLAFGIPAGAAGQDGTNGVTPSFAIGNVSTVAAGGSATVTAATTNNGANVTLNFAIPRGADGAGGSNVTLSDAAPSNLGTASAGTSSVASRSDHVHALPVIAYANLTGVPSNFPTNTTLVSGLSAGYSAIGHAHNYVTSLNNLTGALTLAAGGNVSISSANSTLTISASGGGLDENGTVDGGSYAGEILGGITFTTQPQSQTLAVSNSTLTLSALNVTASGTPSSWLPSGGSFALNAATTTGAAAFNGALVASYWRQSEAGAYYAALISSSDNGSAWSESLNLAATGETIGALTDAPAISFASNGTRVIFTTGLSSSNASDQCAQLRRVDGTDLASSVTVAKRSVYSVAYMPSSGLFLAAINQDAQGAGLFSSPDGVTWTIRWSGNGKSKIHIVNGVAIAVGLGIRRSADGIYWGGFPPYNENYEEIQSFASAASQSRVVILDQNAVPRYSLDGVTWTASSLPNTCNRLSFAAGLFWAFRSTSSSEVYTSPDGVTWTARTLPASGTFVSATSVVASAGPAAILGTAPATASISGGTASANLTAIATADGGQTVSYQWQVSADAGTTWSNVSGANGTTLSLTGLTTADSGERYRSVASATGAASVNSQTAILTVNG